MCSLRLLILLCLLLGLRGLGIAWTVVSNLTLYQDLHVAGSWWVRVLVNAIVGMSFVALGIGLWRRKQWAHRALPMVLIFYSIFSFAWFAVYARSDFDRGRISFVGVTSFIGVCLTLWLRTRIRALFGET